MIGQTISAGPPHDVFRGPVPDIPSRSWDVGANARRFLVLRNVGGRDHPRQPQLILNWFEELKATMGEGSE